MVKIQLDVGNDCLISVINLNDNLSEAVYDLGRQFINNDNTPELVDTMIDSGDFIIHFRLTTPCPN